MTGLPRHGDWVRGRLPSAADAPATGERFDVLHEAGGVVVEHITSSASVEPVPYDQDHDEWVVLLDGDATLDLDGEVVELAAGDWLVLPAGLRHRVLRTVAGTRWLAVHLARADQPPGPPAQ